MKRFISKAMTLVLAQSLTFPAHADITDLPNPFDENSSVASEVPVETAPAEKAPVQNQNQAQSQSSNQNLPGKFKSSVEVVDITRKTNGLVYRIELKPSTSIRKVTVTAIKSKLVLHETYLITESGDKIRVQSLSAAKIENKASQNSEDLNSREKITAIDFRAESMQAEATVHLEISSDESTPVLSQFKPQKEESIAKDSAADSERYSNHIVCKYNGQNIQPYNTVGKLFMGKTGYGYSKSSECKSAIEASNSRGGVAVCNWTGSGYSPYSTTTGSTVGKSHYGFNTLSDCNSVVTGSKSGLLCNWNGSSYSAVKISDNQTFGRVDHGYSQITGCLAIIKHAHNNLFCNWNGRGYSPYNLKTTQTVGRPDHGFNSLETCISNSREATDGVMCNWNGSGYSPYIIHNNIQIGTTGYGFNNLNECQNAANPAHLGFVCNWDGRGVSQYRISNPTMALRSFTETKTCANASLK